MQTQCSDHPEKQIQSGKRVLLCRKTGTVSLRLKPCGLAEANSCLYSLGPMAILKCPTWQCCRGWGGSTSLEHIFMDTSLMWCWNQGLGLPHPCGCHEHLVILGLFFLLLKALHAVRVFLTLEAGVQICSLCPHHCAKIIHSLIFSPIFIYSGGY